MTLCQRPKECEPSRYRHGSDPPRQVEPASPTHSRRAFSPSSPPSSFDPFTYIQSNVTESQAGTMSGPLRGRALACHRLRSLSLFPMPRTKLYFFCMPSRQPFRRTVAVMLGVQGRLLTGSSLIKVERTSPGQPESIQHLFESGDPSHVPMFIIGASMAVDSVVCPKAVRLLLHFRDSVVHVHPRLVHSRQKRT